MRFSFYSVVCVIFVSTPSTMCQDRSPRLNPSIESDMLFEGEQIKPSSLPNQIRIYLQGKDGKVNRLKQPRDQGYPKFPKSDVMLADGEEAQFHQGRDFPTAKPTNFKAGVHGTVIFAGPPDAKEKKVLVLMPTGEVMHYLHASEVTVNFGDEITPFTLLGKTSDHLHLQATDKNNKLIDVDRSFLAGRSPILGSTIKAFEPKWVDVGPTYVGNKKPVVEDGILKVDKSLKVYYDDDAPKGGELSVEEKKLVGRWRYQFRPGQATSTSETIAEYRADRTGTMTYSGLDAYGKREPERVNQFKWTVKGDDLTTEFDTGHKSTTKIIHQDGAYYYKSTNGAFTYLYKRLN